LSNNSNELDVDLNDSYGQRLAKLNSALLPLTFQHEALSFSEAAVLVSQFQNSNDGLCTDSELDKAAQAKSTFIRNNLKLVRKVAIAYSKNYQQIEISDIFQSGVIGLCKAAEKWDPSREFQFSTYATWWIRQSIDRYLLDNYFRIRIPIHFVEIQRRVSNYLDQYLEFFGSFPDIVEAADSLEISVDEYLLALETMYEYQSIEELHDTFEVTNIDSRFCNTFDESISNPEALIIHKSLIVALTNVLDTLSQREAGIMMLRFGMTDGICHTLDEIGKVYGITRERVRQIEKKTMLKLRHPSRSEFLRDYLDLDDSFWSALGSISALKAMGCADGFNDSEGNRWENCVDNYHDSNFEESAT